MNTMSIVAGGRNQAIAGLRKEIRSAVRAEFADRLSKAGLMRRILLRLQMWLMVKNRVRVEAQNRAPKGGQYLGR